MAITLEQLTANAKMRADLSQTNFLTDAQWYILVNKARREMFDLFAQTNARHVENTATGSTVVDQEDYALPAAGADAAAAAENDGAFYKLLAAEIQDSTGEWVSLKPYRHGDRNVLRNDSGLLSTVFGEYFYDIVGSNLRILPAPSAVRTYRLRYIPYPVDLVASPGSPNTVSGIQEHHADFIEIQAALWARIKAEKNTDDMRKERTHATTRLLKSVGGRDYNHPRILGGGRLRYPRRLR